MKRLISMLMVLALCLTVMPWSTPVKAAVYDGFTYEIHDGEVTITRCKESAYGALIIPESIEGYPVTAIGKSAFYRCFLLSSITLPEGIRSIGEKAFDGCSQLKTIYFCSDAPEFATSYGMCYDHEDDPWADLDFDISAKHESGPFDTVRATAYYLSNASGWDAVTSETMTGRGCGYTTAQGEITLKQLALTTVGGAITAFGEGGISLELTYEECYTEPLLMADGTYLFENLLPGRYTLRVCQEGSLTRHYDLMVTEGENTLNVKIHQPGDINGDGKINVGDIAQSYAYVRATLSLDSYQQLCADFTGDGRVTVGDVAKAYAVIQNK